MKTEIVIPTLAERQRGQLLLRALESIHSQGARPLVVVNGSRFDVALVELVGSDHRARLLRLAEPGLPNAIYEGCKAAGCKYFGFLDDDDYLLPGSIASREAALDQDAQADAVVGNGLREEWLEDQRLFKSAEDVQRIAKDPLGELLVANWLTPCGGLYRRATVDADTFLGLTKYAEWTDVAFRLTRFAKLVFLLEHTFVQSDTPSSLSKHTGQARFALSLHSTMRGRLQTALHVQRWNRRVCLLHHMAAEDALAAGSRLLAARHHILSMLHAPAIGLRYFSFSRKFLMLTSPSARRDAQDSVIRSGRAGGAD